jgi:hypothetical protein
MSRATLAGPPRLRIAAHCFGTFLNPNQNMTNEDSLGFAGIGVDDCEAELASFVFEKWGFLKHLLRNHAEARRAEEFPCDLLWEELISDPQYAAQAAMLAKSAERVVIDLGFELAVQGASSSTASTFPG